VVLNGDDAGAGSLRDTVAAASAGAIIGFAADVSEVVLSSKEFSGPHDAHMVLENDVTITGRQAEADRVTVRSDDTLANDTTDGAPGIPVLRTRVFYVAPAATVQLDGLVISGGTFIAAGGAVRNDGDLTISNATLENNLAYIKGGAVYNIGTLAIEGSILQNNQAVTPDAEYDAGYACIDDPSRSCAATDEEAVAFAEDGWGGGLFIEGGTVTIVDSQFDGNAAVNSGGAIYVDTGSVTVSGPLTVINGNDADDAIVTSYATPLSFGGGVANFVDGGFTMTGGSVTGNTSADNGGGLANGSSVLPDLAMVLTDVTVTGNSADFGGGIIHYYDTDAPPATTLELLGTTSVSGNTATSAGGDVFYDDVNAALLAPAALDAPALPDVRDRR